jgi:hypothetical protein
LSLQDKSDLNVLRKQNEDYLAKINKLTKEVDSLKNENTLNMAQIVDLKDQVRNIQSYSIQINNN